MIPDDQVEEVRARADIVGVIGEVVPLRKAGREYKGLCPFHDDRNPSFCVIPEKGFYICMSCRETGDVFSFVMKRLGLDFVEAVRHVAARSGVEIREVSGTQPEEDPNGPLYELNALAREFFIERLADPSGGRRARDYLTSRGIDGETAERFGLGYAPDDWRALRDAASKHGYDDAFMIEAGLLTTSEKSSEPYDRFRDRIVFPIEGLGGKTVAFGGRVLGKGDKGPKYLNSPETPIYHKGDILYGLSWAKNRIRREGAAIVVEGYMDLVALAAAGFENVVATLGTALTERHAVLLSRYTDRVHLLFDSDEAGLRATFRGADTLLAASIHPSVASLPPGEDPDTLVRTQGAAGLREALDHAVDVLDRKLQILDERGAFRDIDHTRRALDRLLPTLRVTADPALRDIYVAKVAERTGVRRETLEADLRGRAARGGSSRGSAGRRSGGTGKADKGRRGAGAGKPRLRDSGLGPERMVLHVLLNRPEWMEDVVESLGEEDFLDPVDRRIFELIVAEDVDAARSDPDPRVGARVEVLRGNVEDLTHARELLDGATAVIQDRRAEIRAEELKMELARTVEEAHRTELVREIALIKQERMVKGANQGAAARAVLRHLQKGS